MVKCKNKIKVRLIKKNYLHPRITKFTLEKKAELLKVYLCTDFLSGERGGILFPVEQ
jgi:hypothetical protein